MTNQQIPDDGQKLQEAYQDAQKVANDKIAEAGKHFDEFGRLYVNSLNKEILVKAFEKAIANGWLPYFANFDAYMTKETIVYLIEEGVHDVMFGVHAEAYVTYAGQYRLTIPEIVFDHDFAKALWGDNDHDACIGFDDYGEHNCTKCDNLYAFADRCWQYHLQQMVIADDLMKYLGEHLND